MIRSAGLPLPVRLRASVHPILQDQYGALTTSLFTSWAELGVEVTVAHEEHGRVPGLLERHDRDRPLRSAAGSRTTTTRTTSRSRSSTRATAACASTSPRPRPTRSSKKRGARAGRAPARASTGSSRTCCSSRRVLMPALPRRGLPHRRPYRPRDDAPRARRRSSTTPRWARGQRQPPRRPRRPARPAEASCTVPIAGVVRKPGSGAGPRPSSRVKSFPTSSRGCMREIEGAQVVPWLASEVHVENDGSALPVPAAPGNPLPRRPPADRARRPLLFRTAAGEQGERPPVGAGADPRSQGDPGRERRPTLEGFHIVSPTEFFIDLEKPISFFPVLISDHVASIVPEGTTHLRQQLARGSRGDRTVPGRRFEPGQRLELERNPHYWREGFPRSEGIVFRFGIQPEEMRYRIHGGALLDRVGPAAARRGCASAGSAFATRVQGVPTAFDVLRRFQRPPRGVRRRGGAPRASSG